MWHYPLISTHLTCKDWKWFWRRQRLQKCPNGQVMAIFCKVTQNPHFLKKCKGGPKEKFFKNRPKSNHRWKGLRALWRKWHYPPISMRLKCKDWKRFWRKRRLQKGPNNQVMAIFARSPNTRIFWKSANWGLREIFQKSPKKMPSLKGPKAHWRKWHYPLRCT